MFILAIVDTATQRSNVQNLLSASEFQVDFADPEDRLTELCDQTDPDALLLMDRYADVSARFILKHLPPGSADSLPEKILILGETEGPSHELDVSPGIHALWVPPSELRTQLLGLPPDAPASESDVPAQRRILHITDDRLLRRIVADLIHNRTPYGLESAATGEEGLRLQETYHPDLILTDWDLPDIDGIELCRRIKVDQQDSHVTIALFSSMTDEHLIEAAYKAHARAYIIKPVQPELLLHKIERLMTEGAGR